MTTAVRRAKNARASKCEKGKECGKFYTYLGRYDNYTSNPNGFFPFPPPYPGPPLSYFNSPATVGMYGVLRNQ